MAWAHHYGFKHRSASGFKAFIEPWERERFPSKTRKGGTISLINVIYWALRKGIFSLENAQGRNDLPRLMQERFFQPRKRSNPSRNWPKAVGLGKEQHSKANLFWEARMRSYPDAKLPESRIYTILWRIYPKAGLKAKLNSTTMATFVLHIPPFKVIQSISKSEPLQTFKNFEGGLVDTLKKDKIRLAWTMSKLVDIYKRQVKDRLIGPNNV